MSTLNSPQDPRYQVANPMDKGLFRLLPLAAVILAFVLVAANYQSLADSIPTHFNGRGEVDGYGSKVMLWVLPVLNLGLFYFLGLAAKSDFRWFNYPVKITEENAAIQHAISLELVATMRAVLCLMIAYLVFAIIRSAQMEMSMLNMWFFGSFLLALFGAIGWGTLKALRAR